MSAFRSRVHHAKAPRIEKDMSILVSNPHPSARTAQFGLSALHGCAVRSAQSAVRNPQSAVRSPQCAVRSAQSAVRSPQCANIDCFFNLSSFIFRSDDFLWVPQVRFLLPSVPRCVTAAAHYPLEVSNRALFSMDWSILQDFEMRYLVRSALEGRAHVRLRERA